MEFITIDFETATSQRDTPCEIGLTFVENSKIIQTKSWLIKPIDNEFDDFNTLIHGIKPNDVKTCPEFDVIWKEIKPLINNKLLIAHNAGFDMSVLRNTLDTYYLPFPNITFTCSYIFSKKIWKGFPSYDLKTLCKIHNIDLIHHRAGPDSRATAELTLKAFEVAGVTSIEDFPIKLKTTIGRIDQDSYRPSESKRIFNAKEWDKLRDPSKNNPESIFFEKKIVFTGTLSSMVRSEAENIIFDIGGIIKNSVTKDTDYLIVGQQDYRIIGDDGMSKKQKMAMDLVNNGSLIEIISEDDFLKNI